MRRQPEALVRLHVQPRAARDEVLGWRDDTLRVRVTVCLEYS
mgnify:CR=1 FL=1